MSENLFLGDIEKAFLQVSVKEEDRDLLLNVNWKEKHQRFMRVPFGVKSNPFLLGASLQYHLDQQVPRFEHTETELKENTYIGFYGHFVPSQIIPFYSQIVAHFRWKTRYKTNLFLASLLKEKGVLMSSALVSAPSLTHSPWAAVTARADPRPFYRLWRHQFWLSRITLSADLCRVKGSFKPYQNEHNSVKDTREKRQKKTCKFDLKISMKILLHYPSTVLFI